MPQINGLGSINPYLSSNKANKANCSMGCCGGDSNNNQQVNNQPLFGSSSNNQNINGLSLQDPKFYEILKAYSNIYKA